ncbi:MAG: S-methyl-5-thioribose-1-phosphate isomerase, partial [Planctomycetota bacterium]
MSAPIQLPFETLRWEGDLDGHVVLLEQTRLPMEEVDLPVRTVPEMVDAIWRLAVRGAPAIGVAAGYGMVLGVRDAEGDVLEAARRTKATLDAARPTAVNLSWATARILRRLEGMADASGDALRAATLDEARAIDAGDRDKCRRPGEVDGGRAS